ncbi:MAG TPA: hypothetical protein PKN87_01580 [Syntrophomonadaceae bacterium]|nr:hypothetical protein [Syntrophomonadaceae bacterium]
MTPRCAVIVSKHIKPASNDRDKNVYQRRCKRDAALALFEEDF